MNFKVYFEYYRELVARADQTFDRIKGAFPGCVTCSIGCSDCCQAVFGLFLIEAAHIQEQFLKLDPDTQRKAIERSRIAERKLEALEAEFRAHRHDPEASREILGRWKIPCPLLGSDQACILYAHRPITCRTYGIPVAIHGSAHVCGHSAFGRGKPYPSFNMDQNQKALCHLTQTFLEETPNTDPEKAYLLISMSKTLQPPIEEIIQESFQ